MITWQAHIRHTTFTENGIPYTTRGTYDLRWLLWRLQTDAIIYGSEAWPSCLTVGLVQASLLGRAAD